jgi:3-hydroxyacyl-CoA dehydrogenase/enoyl-CoA hydratase/3-hydroxybutyryl-CoA epimerase
MEPYALHTEMRDGVAIITFDLPGEPVNKFSKRVKDEFLALFDQLEADATVRAAVLISGKPDIWVAGADIEEFLELRTEASAEQLSRDGQAMLDRLARLRTPVVAAIHGACLGGGLEAALACAHRIATDSPKTSLGLPEVQLGLIPGAGGTQRLPALVGLRAALDMMLTSKNLRARKALQIGLVDEVVHPSILRDVAERRARELGAKQGPPRRGRSGTGGVMRFLLDGNSLGRGIVLRKARDEVTKRTRGQYPAPLAALRAVEAGYSMRRADALREEAKLFGQMAMTPVSRELIFLFFASTALKKDPGVSAPVPDALPVRKLAVLGAGFMGAGIASIAMQQGTVVRLKDAEHARVGKGFAAIRGVLMERVTRKQLTRRQLDDLMLLVTGTVDYSGFADVQLAIEAVFEDLAVKQQVVRELEGALPASAIIASNTSTIPIARIAEASQRPERVLGMHFFSPVHKMPLLEVIVSAKTAPQVVTTAVAYGKQLGKTVIVVRDGPGFYANRILSPYVNEAGRLLDDGVAIDAVDAALVEFGFPVGPITLIDEVGLDVAGKAGATLSAAFGARMAPPRSLESVIAAGRTGRKGKLGFYRYDDAGKKGDVDGSVYTLLPTGERRIPVPANEISERCVLAMVNEAARCLEEGVIRAARDGDVGAVFGIGFPPFRGGPFRYVDAIGADAVVARLEDLDGRFPGRFTPADLLVRMARSRSRFYPADGKPTD